ncbi:uncharacterized protein RB166_020000 [Leptodactylus fuscus]|uniref:uncharacterized protein LOC142184420 n=1 Tax=Leptodactylus fuscus TaxID=238119 RepID=UPI003F4EE16B
MKSPPTETGPPNQQEEPSAETDKPPTAKEQPPNETEKDSGYSDSSSDSLSSEDTTPSTTTSVTAATPDTAQTETAYTPIYILQNVVLKQPRLLVLQPPLRRHRKRTSPSSYLPILRSYPRIAPRLSPPSPAPDPPKDTAPTPPASKVRKQIAPPLLEVSLRSLALLRRTRETQRSIRELRAHARLYERALKGEEGGWERLRKAMERSGGYRKIPPATDLGRTEEEGEAAMALEANSMSSDSATAEEPEPHIEEAVTSPRECVTSSETAPPDSDTDVAV